MCAVGASPPFPAAPATSTAASDREGALQFRAEAFNIFNQKNYKTIETSLTNANFGRVTEYETQRIMQFGAKLTF